MRTRSFARPCTKVIVLTLTMLILSACQGALFAGIPVVGHKVVQERSIGNAVDDNIIFAEVKSNYAQTDIDNLFTNVSVEVHEGRVLLTGTVKDPQHRIDAVRQAWLVKGVKEVINEIQVTDRSSIKDYAQDIWISTQVRGKFILNKHISSINYTADTVNGIVYLMGVAQDAEELDTATYIAGTIRGVKKVISHVRLKDDPLRS